MIDLSLTQTIMCNAVYVYSLLKTEGNIIVGSLSLPARRTDKCKLSQQAMATLQEHLLSWAISHETLRRPNDIYRKCNSIREFTVIHGKHRSTKWKHQRTQYNCSRTHIRCFHHINGGYIRWNSNINRLSGNHCNNRQTYYTTSSGLLSRRRPKLLGGIRAMQRNSRIR